MRTDNLPVTRAVVFIAIIILAAMLLVAAWVAAKIPAGTAVPVHWNASGQVDRYGSKTEGLLVIPVSTLFLAVVLAVFPLFEPRQSNFMRSSKAYTATCAALLLFMLVLHGAIALSSAGKQVNVPGVIFGAMGLLFVVIGNYLGKTRSNFIYGIRTPWTLSSELSWSKTHRLGGKLFMAWGAIQAVAAPLVREPWLAPVFLGGMIGVSVLCAAYSYVIWKRDPNKHPAGSRPPSE